ncbi:hypothetical protein JI57_04170 [Psychromonas sp. PRT-SC03]|nr:hypothetical protein JI57_04170 [Psychromonas sp. PRT-SC03]
MSAHGVNLPLSIIGVASSFVGAEGIDDVAHALYMGKITKTDVKANLKLDVLDLLDEVFSVHALVAEHICVLMIGTFSLRVMDDIKQRHVHVEAQCSLTKALLRASAIISETKFTVQHVLLVAMSETNESIDTPASISFSRDFKHYGKRQGAACVLLTDKGTARSLKSTCYATLNNMAWGSTSDIANVITTSLQQNDLESRDICTLEVSACAQENLTKAEQQGILRAYSHSQKIQTAISCQKSVFGDNGDLSQLMALVHGALYLYQRYRPALSWSAPNSALLAAWQDSPFYFLAKSAPVFMSAENNVRYSALSLLDDTQYTHLVMSAFDDGLVHKNGFNASAPNSLFIISVDNIDALMQTLNSLKVSGSLKGLARDLYCTYQSSKRRYTLVLIADSVAQLESEKALALLGVRRAILNTTPWKTPKGSYFASEPPVNTNVAFLYPGIGATYIGFGDMLLQMFPEIYPKVLTLTDDNSASLKDKLLNPRSVCALSPAELNVLELNLRHDLTNIAEAGVGYACVLTAIFEQVLNIKATYACGYSMGEVSMFAALGCWQNPGAMSARLAHSDTFNHQLCNELYSVRKHWDLAAPIKASTPKIWETYAIKGTYAQVIAAINDSDRVYITIINTQNNLLIAGDPAHCLALCERLGVRAIALNIGNAIHCAPAYLQYAQMLNLYSMPVSTRIQTKMLSSSCYLPIPQHQHAIAVSIAKCLCEPVDFPRLINVLAQKDVNVYIEMGAGRSLSGWTDKILKEKMYSAHISVPVNVKCTDQHLSLLRALAKLLSFGVAPNIERFFNGSLLNK